MIAMCRVMHDLPHLAFPSPAGIQLSKNSAGASSRPAKFKHDANAVLTAQQKPREITPARHLPAQPELMAKNLFAPTRPAPAKPDAPPPPTVIIAGANTF
jgi:hypothetical protein